MTKKELTDLMKDIPDDAEIIVSSGKEVSVSSELHTPDISFENGKIFIKKGVRVPNRIDENGVKTYGTDGGTLETALDLKEDELEYLVLKKKYLCVKKESISAFYKFRKRRRKDERKEQKLLRKKQLSEELRKAREERYRIRRIEEKEQKKQDKIDKYYKDLEDSVELCY